MRKLRYCVITRGDGFSDGLLLLRGSQWRYYTGRWPEGLSDLHRFKPVKVQAFCPGELLILDDFDREVGAPYRAPFKWGTEEKTAQKYHRHCGVEFVIFNSLSGAVALAKKIGGEVGR